MTHSEGTRQERLYLAEKERRKGISHDEKMDQIEETLAQGERLLTRANEIINDHQNREKV